MPYDSNGVYSLPSGYLAVDGQTIQPSQHNPPLEDIASGGLSLVLVRDGRAPMTGPLNMNSNKVTNVFAGSNALDAVNKTQLDAVTAKSILTDPGYFTGLTLTTNGSDTANDIDIAAGGAASDVSPVAIMTLSSAITKRIDALWTVGTNQGGLDTGAASDSTYWVWLIQRSDTLVVDVLFSLSKTAPTMPANYDRKRLIGQVFRKSATNSRPWSMGGDYSSIPSGSVIDRAVATYSAYTSFTTAMSVSSLPTITTGTEILTTTIAPKSSVNVLRARAIITGALTTSEYWAAALFANGATNALAATPSLTSLANGVTQAVLEWEWVPGSFAPIVIAVRVGPAAGRTLWLNGNSNTQFFGGASYCTLVIEEIKVSP